MIAALGAVRADGSTCERCPVGTFSTVGAHGTEGGTTDVCPACPAGKGGTLTHNGVGNFQHTSLTFFTGKTKNMQYPAANAIFSTLYGGAESCTDCPAGWFANDEAGNQPCTRCPKGWSSDVGEAECTKCLAGKAVNDGTGSRRRPSGCRRI